MQPLFSRVYCHNSATVVGKDALSSCGEDSEEEEDVAERFGIAEDKGRGSKTRWQIVRARMWTLLDDPYSSPWAKARYIPKQIFVENKYLS